MVQSLKPLELHESFSFEGRFALMTQEGGQACPAVEMVNDSTRISLDDVVQNLAAVIDDGNSEESAGRYKLTIERIE